MVMLMAFYESQRSSFPILSICVHYSDWVILNELSLSLQILSFAPLSRLLKLSIDLVLNLDMLFSTYVCLVLVLFLCC